MKRKSKKITSKKKKKKRTTKRTQCKYCKQTIFIDKEITIEINMKFIPYKINMMNYMYIMLTTFLTVK